LGPPGAQVVVTPPGPLIGTEEADVVCDAPLPGPPDPLVGPDEVVGVGDGPPPPPMVEQVTPVGAALTQLHTAPAEVITALSDAAGQAVMTQGTAAWEIDAYLVGLHWHA
jgi:hypothetical protein